MAKAVLKSTPWWLQSDRDMAKTAYNVLRSIRNQDTGRLTDYLHYLEMYAGKKLTMLGAMQYFQGFSSPVLHSVLADRQSRIRWNLSRAVIDSSVAKIGKNRPTPSPITFDADATVRRKSKKLGQALYGTMRENRIHRDGTIAFRDAAILGDVFHYSHRTRAGKIKTTRLFPWEVYVDHRDAYRGDPTCLWIVKSIERYRALELFGKKSSTASSAILDAPCSLATANTHSGSISAYQNLEMIEIFEAWHLRSHEGMNDGVHIMGTAAGLIGKERYMRDTFPVKRFGWSPSVTGYWSQSLVEEVRGIQNQITRMLHDIHERMHLGSRPQIMEHYTAKVRRYTNKNFDRVIWRGGIKPSIEVAATSHPEYYSFLQTLWDKGWEIPGVSQLFGASQKPAGVESGKAMLVYNDIGSARFAPVGQRWENFHMDLCEDYFDIYEDLYSDDVDVEIRTMRTKRRSKLLESIKWSDVRMARDEFELQIMPMSSLPVEAAGRQQIVQGWIQMGVIGQTEAKMLMDIPDTDAYLSLDLAQYDVVLDALDRIVEDGEPQSPLPYDDLNLVIKLSNATIHRARLDREAEETLVLLQEYHDAAVSMQQQKDMALMNQAGGMGQGAANGGPIEQGGAGAGIPPELAGLAAA